MRKVTVTDMATQQLELITEYLSVFGPATARSFALEYDRIWKLLADGTVELPLARDSKLAQAGYRFALIKNYILLYRVITPDEILITHVFHQSQDYAKLVVE